MGIRLRLAATTSRAFKVYSFRSLHWHIIPFCGWRLWVWQALSVRQLVDTWVVPTFWLLWIMMLWAYVYKFWYKYMFSVLLDLKLEVEMLGYRVALCLLRNCQTSQKWCHHFTFPLTRGEGSNFSTSSLTICLLENAILEDVKWIFFLVSIGVFLMANDIWHLFVCLLAICMSSLEKCVFTSFAHGLIILFFHCWLNGKIIYVFWIQNIWYANIFSNSVSCLLAFLIASREAHSFKIFMKSNIYFFPLVACVLVQ